MPFFERNWVVQSRSRLTVHGSSPFVGRLASWLIIALPHRAQALPLARCSLPAQTLLLVEVAQGANEFAKVAGDDGVKLVEVQVDAVVGDAVLREVVGADALAALA